MSEISPKRTLPQGLLGRITGQIESHLAPIVAPYLPERYYEVYRRSLAALTEQMPVLAGLPEATMESGHVPLYMSASDSVAAPQTIWGALSRSPRLLIIGCVGSGKSTLLRSVAWEFSSRPDKAFIASLTFKLFGRSVEELVPLWVDLGQFAANSLSLTDTILASLARLGFPGASKFLTERLRLGQCLVLLDGLDQVRDPGQQRQMSELVSAYPQSIWLACARPLSPLASLPDFATMILGGMARSDLASYLDHNLGAHSAGKAEILAATERNQAVAALAQLPLMLAAMSRAFLARRATAATLPVLCDACLQTLVDEWLRGPTSGNRSTLEDKLRALGHVAWEMQGQEKSALTRAELVDLINKPESGVSSAAMEAMSEELTWCSGVLCLSADASERYAFAAPILCSYLAARWITSVGKVEALLSFADMPWWRDTIVAAASLSPDATSFIRALQAQASEQPYKWYLLASCLAELPACDAALRMEVSDALYALLEADDEVHWLPAATAIAGLARKQVKEYFSSLIRDPDPKMRRCAALVLGRLHQEWAIPSLGGAISGDAEQNVRVQAAWALGYVASPQAVPVLSRALRGTSADVREMAASSLARLGRIPGPGEAAVRELVNALGDENAETARLAEHALIQVGRGAMSQLMMALNDRRVRQVQRSRVAKALGRLGDEHALPILIEAILSGTAEDLQDYVEAVAAVGGNAVGPLIKALGGKDVTTGSGLVAALVKIGAPAVQPLIESIAGMAPEVRNAAVRALEQIGAPAVEPLIHALLHDERYEVRRRALEVLGHISENTVGPALIQALGDPDQGVRTNAVRYLGNFGDAGAVPSLVNILRTDENLALRRTAVESLSAIGDASAIPALLDALEDPPLREAASLALPRLGPVVVEPLVERLHAPEATAETREAIWGVLAHIGATARPEEETFFGLANAYARLHEANQSPEEVLAVTERLSWWPRGVEVHRSLATAHSLAGIHDLESISGCGTYLEWMSAQTEWFRPQVRNILWGFRDIVENIRLYRTLTRRDAQRDALLSSIDKLAELQDLTQRTALPVEQAFLDRVITIWRLAILDGIKQLRGRASLLIELLTPRLPLRAGQVRTVAAFRLFNQGDSAARNFSVTVKPAALHGIEIIDGENRSLEPLGIGEERQVDVNLVPHGLREADLSFEAHYDDDEREGVTQPFSCRIGFVDAPSVYTPIVSSPYVAGLPIRTPEMFFGRQDIFAWVRDNISSTHQDNALLLYGERRMGKTSVLYQLQLNPPTPNHIFLLFDLQLYSYINTIHELLYEMCLAIIARLGRESIALEEPDLDQFEANPHRSFRAFCALLDNTLGERRVVVMLDEFGVLMLKVRNHVFEPTIFDFLRGIIQSSRAINFLFTGAYEVRRMQEDYDSILFNMVRVRKISYLEPGETTELIEKPMAGLLSYHPLVVQRIRTVTACHPYFVQYVCEELVQLARSERRNYVELSDLDLVVKNVVHDATGNIEKSIYNYLGDSEKLALAALASATDDVRVFVTLADIAAVLERRNLGMQREELQQALKALEERDLITEMRIGQQLRYAFRMGLVRMWLRQNEMLLRLSQE